MDAEAIVTVSAAVVALVQLVKWMGIPDTKGPLVVLGLSALGVALFVWSRGLYARELVFALFAAWIAVATSAAGVFGFTRASAAAITSTKETKPPTGAGASPTT